MEKKTSSDLRPQTMTNKKLAQQGQLRFALASSRVRTKQGHNDDSPFRLFEHVCHAVVAEGHHHLGAGLEEEKRVVIIQNKATSWRAFQIKTGLLANPSLKITPFSLILSFRIGLPLIKISIGTVSTPLLADRWDSVKSYWENNATKSIDSGLLSGMCERIVCFRCCSKLTIKFRQIPLYFIQSRKTHWSIETGASKVAFHRWR